MISVKNGVFSGFAYILDHTIWNLYCHQNQEEGTWRCDHPNKSSNGGLLRFKLTKNTRVDKQIKATGWLKKGAPKTFDCHLFLCGWKLMVFLVLTWWTFSDLFRIYKTLSKRRQNQEFDTEVEEPRRIKPWVQPHTP